MEQKEWKENIYRSQAEYDPAVMLFSFTLGKITAQSHSWLVLLGTASRELRCVRLSRLCTAQRRPHGGEHGLCARPEGALCWPALPERVPSGVHPSEMPYLNLQKGLCTPYALGVTSAESYIKASKVRKQYPEGNTT